jgi:dephospho-CoA kinase
MSGVLRVSLTGGIATGKSYCLAKFSQMGVPVIDADQIARDVVRSGSPALEAVVRRFGPSVRRPDGELDRRALADVVFRDAAARADLEAILHPLVYTAINEWFESLVLPLRVFAMADIPLLYETGRERDFQRTVVAACRAEQQLERMRRRGYSAEDAAARLSAQLPIVEKARRADYRIDTSGTFEDTDRQVVQVSEELGLMRDA